MNHTGTYVHLTRVAALTIMHIIILDELTKRHPHNDERPPHMKTDPTGFHGSQSRLFFDHALTSHAKLCTPLLAHIPFRHALMHVCTTHMIWSISVLHT